MKIFTEMHLSNWDLKYMIPKGISQTSISNRKCIFRKGKQIKGAVHVVLIWKYESLYYCNFIIPFGNTLYPLPDSWMAASSNELLYRMLYFQTEHYNSVWELFSWYLKRGLAKSLLGIGHKNRKLLFWKSGLGKGVRKYLFLKILHLFLIVWVPHGPCFVHTWSRFCTHIVLILYTHTPFCLELGLAYPVNMWTAGLPWGLPTETG